MAEEPNLDITTQAVGAYGEKIVEAELLRHGWIPANANKTVPNAAVFDIFAYRGKSLAAIRVRACGPTQNEFVFRKFDPDETFATHDFTVLVKMGANRKDDEIYVIPTSCLHRDVERYRQQGTEAGMKDVRWTLYLDDHPSDKLQCRRGFRKKWAAYRDHWTQLEEHNTPV
jgi:hypothetical protein